MVKFPGARSLVLIFLSPVPKHTGVQITAGHDPVSAQSSILQPSSVNSLLISDASALCQTLC